jgi:hypothetical protein
MSKIKNYIMDIEEQVMSTDLENIISESEHVSEAQKIVVELLELKTHFDINIAENYVSEMWNEFWGNYAY